MSESLLKQLLNNPTDVKLSSIDHLIHVFLREYDISVYHKSMTDVTKLMRQWLAYSNTQGITNKNIPENKNIDIFFKSYVSAKLSTATEYNKQLHAIVINISPESLVKTRWCNILHDMYSDILKYETDYNISIRDELNMDFTILNTKLTFAQTKYYLDVIQRIYKQLTQCPINIQSVFNKCGIARGCDITQFKNIVQALYSSYIKRESMVSVLGNVLGDTNINNDTLMKVHDDIIREAEASGNQETINAINEMKNSELYKQFTEIVKN